MIELTPQWTYFNIFKLGPTERAREKERERQREAEREGERDRDRERDRERNDRRAKDLGNPLTVSTLTDVFIGLFEQEQRSF